MSTLSPQRRHEEKRLFRAFRSGDRHARDELVERFLPLARSLARRYARQGEPIDDLEQVASLALIKAIDGFDTDRGTAFSSYAVPSIAGAIKRHYRDFCWSIRPPRDMQDLAVKVVRASDELSAMTGAPPTAKEIAEHLGVSVESVVEAREAYCALRCDSLDQPARRGDDDESESLLNMVGVQDHQLAGMCDRVTLEALLDGLDDRERLIVQLYYQHELTQVEIGKRLGYSQMHISRILRGAVKHLVRVASEHEAWPSGRAARWT